MAPATHPPYREMILTAISELKEKDGSNKLAISKKIETIYGGGRMPENHSELLTEALAKMKEAGQLVFFRNNYSRPDLNVAPRRGRGRPPNPKPSVPEGAALAAQKQVASMPKKRGRPKKISAGVVPSPLSSSKRGRGRPPKAQRPADDG